MPTAPIISLVIGISASHVMAARAEQFKKDSVPISFKELGRWTDFNLSQPSNTWSPKCVTEFGISTNSRFLQRAKASPPMVVTELGIVRVFKL